MPQLAQAGYRLGRPKTSSMRIAEAQRDRTARWRVVGDRRAAPALVLRHMRGHRLLAQLHDKIGGVVTLVGTQRHPGRSARGSASASAARRSAWPEARVATAPTTRPLRFSISACPMKTSRASLPGPLRISRASGSVVETWVSLAPLAAKIALAVAPRGGRIGRVVFRAETFHARPRLQQRAVDRKRLVRQQALHFTLRQHRGNFCATSPAGSQSRFFVKVVASHTESSSMPRPTNQRNSRS